MVDVCDFVPADGCCGVIPCVLCIEWETYQDGIVRGSALLDQSVWIGSVAGISFASYWEVNYETGECEYVVIFDGEEVYRASCYEGASCRDPAGEAFATVNYKDGTIRWSVYDPLELPLIDDPDTGCRTYFCDDCRCSCEEICVDVTEVIYDIITQSFSGTLVNTSYPCDPPVWAGRIGNYDLSIALGRDEYGQCILIASVDGYEQEPVLAPGCSAMASVITLADGSMIRVKCKQCECVEQIGDCICGRPMGETLRVLWSSGNGAHGSAPRDFLLTYGMVNEPEISCLPWSPGAFPAYRGSVTGTFPLPMGGTRSDTLEVILVCECVGCTYCVYHRWLNDFAPITWHQGAYTVLSCDCPAILDVLLGFEAGNSWGYQISDVSVYELEENC
jgi:hypothetical protein